MSPQGMKGLVAQICHAETPGDSTALFSKYRAELKSWTFVLKSRSGWQPGFVTSRDFSNGAAIRTSFGTNKMIILDERMLQGLTNREQITFGIDYSIGFDSQVVDYLRRFIGEGHGRVPDDTQEVFDFLLNRRIDFDPSPYLQENLTRRRSPKDLDKIFERVRAYELLRTVDREHYLLKREV